MSDPTGEPPRERMPHPGVRIPSPVIFAAAFLLGWFIETRVGRLALVGTGAAPRNVQMIAMLLLAAGLAIMTWGVMTFIRHKTTLIPFRPASRLVDAGPYRYSRNPMYTGTTVAYVGLAWLVNMGWPLLLLPFALLGVYLLVIKREERYLLDEFGPEYEAYRRRVRRWF